MAVIGFLSQMIIYVGRNIVKVAVLSEKEWVLSTLVAPDLTSTSSEGKRSCIVLIIFAVTIDWLDRVHKRIELGFIRSLLSHRKKTLADKRLAKWSSSFFFCGSLVTCWHGPSEERPIETDNKTGPHPCLLQPDCPLISLLSSEQRGDKPCCCSLDSYIQ